MCLRIENFVRDFSLCPYMQFSERCLFFFYVFFFYEFFGEQISLSSIVKTFLFDRLYEEILFREKEAQVSKGFFSEPHYFLGTKLSQVWSS